MSSKPIPVVIPYSDLAHPQDPSLRERLRQALGSHRGALGIVVISELPGDFPALREKLFRLAQELATLPVHEKQKLERPDTSYMFGWSHGKEVMNGRPDTQKGSYYANPLLDQPDVSEQLRQDHPEYYAGNVWPNGIQRLEEFEETFKSLGCIIFEAGLLLAKACDEFVVEPSDRHGTISSLIQHSKSNKARLLHYYPQDQKVASDSQSTLGNDALCGTHLDHSLLTGLCSAMYLDAADPSKVVPSPSDTTGLWIYPRESDTAVKVSIPEQCLAFQTGEALSLLTSQRLAATPHFVSGSTASTTPVSRETFAFFLQPDVDDVIGEDKETFGAFTKRVLGRHYQGDVAAEAED
ncbi:hypothetical protein I350_00356 [Cryptococcus amylolentus CBS 6273]|uniref:Non-haem dioxygenase N-terminal domain-containing protein n=1 Tax=Cryptococcus amylolentus CBS 6273 TaxID=1296118 RepID=A0A1E3KEY4_9TREE|nr:hypothetical protein I350_00356 [Cryptococcus amylolentus CBS 6273]